MVKIFVGNLSTSTTREDLQSLFSQYGKVAECDVLRNFGFVHMDSKQEAEEAVQKLHQHLLNGFAINVELSRGKPKGTTKLHVSNISSDCTSEQLRVKFEVFGPVAECDIVKDYAFVHMERREDAMEAVTTLNNSEFQGKRINVQLSTSRLRTAPGMGSISGCYICGEPGHWSKDCRRSQNGSYAGGVHSSRGYPSAGPPAYASSAFPASLPPRGYTSTIPVISSVSHTPTYGISRVYSTDTRYLSQPVSTYLERSTSYEHERYSSTDDYEKYRARSLSSRYLEDRHLSIPPPPPPPPLSSSSLSRMRLAPSSLDLYDRHAVPPSSASSSSATSAYYSRDRSPIRRVDTGSEVYSYERSRLSPVSRSSSYAVSRSRESSTERSRYSN